VSEAASETTQVGEKSRAVQDLKRTASLLGVDAHTTRKLDGPLRVHELLAKGLPAKVIDHLLKGLTVLPAATLLTRVVRVSVRQHQRLKNSPGKPLGADLSERTWMLAEILAKATAMLGSQKEAELWLDRPAVSLNHKRPLELLTTLQGMKIDDTYIEQIRHGSYV
jgi:putative toxin-antitoxin system antitoxin component (TIGR02293 family)